jgi:S-adenosylmethionine hydrolase
MRTNRVTRKILGRVASINEQGDLVSDIANAAIESLVGQANVEVRFGEHFTQGVHPLEHGEPDQTLIAVLGRSGCLEIGIVGVNVHEMLGIDVGQSIEIAVSD